MIGGPVAARPEALPPRPALGAVLVQRGFLTEEQLAFALAEQATTGRPLGEIIVGHGLVTGPLVAQALATQAGGLLKTEYGYATGFAKLPDPAATPEVDFAAQPAAVPVDPLVEAQVAELARQLSDARAEVDALRAHELELQAYAAAVAGERDVARTDAASAAELAGVLKSELLAARADAEQVRPQLAEAAAMAAERHALAQRSAALEAELSGAREHAEQLRAQVALLEVDAEQAPAAEAELAVARTDAEQLRARLGELERDAERAAAVEVELAAVHGHAEHLRARLAELEGGEERAAAVETELAAAHAHAEQLLAGLAEGAAARDALAQHGAELESELAVARADAEQLRIGLGQLEAEAAVVAAAGDEARAEAAAAVARAAALEEVVASLRMRPEPAAESEWQERIMTLELRLEDAFAQMAALGRARGGEQGGAVAEASAAPESSGPHLVFSGAADGYQLLERSGPPPAPGGTVELDGVSYLVVRVGAAPLPGTSLRCAYLNRVA
jgi:hypothetical protein